MTVFTNPDYLSYNQHVAKWAKNFRYMIAHERRECLRLYPEVLMHLPNPSEGEIFVAVTMKPSLVLFLDKPSRFICLVATALDPTLRCQLLTPRRKEVNDEVVDEQIIKSYENADGEFNINSFNATRMHPTGGYATLEMNRVRRENVVIKGHFDDAPVAIHQDAMQQIHSILTLARSLNDSGKFNINSVKWLWECLPVVNHWALPMLAAALGIRIHDYGKLEEQPVDVLETLFSFNGHEAYMYWSRKTDDVPIPAACWEAMLRTDGWALNFLYDRDYKHRANPSAKLCKIALSNASGVHLLLFEGGSRSSSFKKLKLESVKAGLTKVVDEAASEYEDANGHERAGAAVVDKLQKHLIDFLDLRN